MRLESATFEKDGKTISFQKVHLTREGEGLEGAVPEFQITEAVESHQQKTRAAKKRSKAAAKVKENVDPNKAKALKAWRLAEAKKQGVPAFRVMTDATLEAIVAAEPGSDGELLEVHGMGARSVEKYGKAILAALR